MIKWNERKNFVFVFQILLAIVTPVLAYAGLTPSDITTWGAAWQLVIDAVSNPYILVLICVSVWNAINDPRTAGLTDTEK